MDSDTIANIGGFMMMVGPFLLFIALLGWSVHLQQRHAAKSKKVKKG